MRLNCWGGNHEDNSILRHSYWRFGHAAFATKLCEHSSNGFDFDSCNKVGDKVVISIPGIWIGGNWYVLAGISADASGKPPSDDDQTAGQVTPNGDTICAVLRRRQKC